jgi:hypothetical protein
MKAQRIMRTQAWKSRESPPGVVEEGAPCGNEAAPATADMGTVDVAGEKIGVTAE